MKPTIIIIGAGGHGKVVYDAIVSQNKYQVLGFIDSQLSVGTKVIGNAEIICSQENVGSLVNQAEFFIVAIGNNKIRAQVFDHLSGLFKPAVILHARSVIGSDVKIGEGTVVLANAVINALTVVGKNAIINTAVVVDHECTIGNHTYLKLGTIMANNTIAPDFFTSEMGQNINN